MATTVQDSISGLMDVMNPKQTKTAKSAVEETQDRFMTLLITQMKNQDPMNPLDNAQVTSQFAQLSTVSGINKLNDTMTSLMANYQTSQTLQAASMIGHGVLAPGSSLTLANGNALMGVDLPQAVDKLSVSIRDSKGIEVRTIDFGPQKAGSLPIAWDGKTADGSAAADGKYTFSVTASKSGATVSGTALQFGLVGTVSTGANGVKLNVDGLGEVTMSDVREIL